LEAARCPRRRGGDGGALPSVVGGLVNRPVIAVPPVLDTDQFWGITALLAMLNSCARVWPWSTLIMDWSGLYGQPDQSNIER